MWKTPVDKGLTEKEVTDILHDLWKQAVIQSTAICPDCGAFSGNHHKEGCDVARCSSCAEQKISCDCKDPRTVKWDGMWPGTKYCYENRLIVWSQGTGWMFDYNAIRKTKKHDKL